MTRPQKKDSEKSSAVLPPIRCTVNEKTAITEKAKQLGLSVSEYVRQMALKGSIIVRQSLADFTYLQQLRSIGVNLNQQTRKLNATGKDTSELESLRRKLDAMLEKLLDKS